MILFLAIVCLGTAVYFLTEFVTTPARERRNLLNRAAQYGQMRVMHGREMPRFRERAFAPIVSKLARLMLKVNPRTSLDSVNAKLAMAGMRRTSPAAFLAAKALLGLGGLVLGLVFASSATPLTGFLSVILFTFVGFFAPGYWVTLRGRRRQDLVSSELPD